jgi:hypothetical protein
VNVRGEVVRIIDRNRPIDAASYDRSCGWVRELPSGYCVALWPAGTKNPRFLHDGLSGFGSYGRRSAAEAALAAVHPERPALRFGA